MPTELPDYLRPDFDPTNVTILRLRSILFERDVTFSADCKKTVLVELFRTEVLPHVERLRSKHLNVKRSTKGIEDFTGGPCRFEWDNDE